MLHMDYNYMKRMHILNTIIFVNSWNQIFKWLNKTNEQPYKLSKSNKIFDLGQFSTQQKVNQPPGW